MAINNNLQYSLSGAQVKDLASRVNNLKTNAGAPTTSTVGTVGQLLADTTNGKLYICTAIVPGTDPDPDTYTWEEVGEDSKILYASGWLTDSGTVTFYKDIELTTAVTRAELTEITNTGGVGVAILFSDPEQDPFYDVYRIIGAQNDYDSLYWTVTSLSQCFILDFTSSGTQATVRYNLLNSTTGAGSSTGQVLSQYAVTNLLNGRIKTNAGPPTSSTVGTVGQLLEDTTNGKLYICTDATNPYVWEEVGTGGGSNTMVLYTNQNLPDAASSSYHLYSDVNLTTTVNTRDIYDCYKSGGDVVLFIPTSSDNPGQIYGGYVTDLHQITFDTDDDVYYVSFVVKEYNSNPKLYNYSGSAGNWEGKTDFVDAVSPSALNGIITTNAGAPTSSTAGTVGQLLEDTTNGKLYICTGVSGSTYTWTEIDYSGLTTLSYGNSTWNDFLTAYNAGKIVYCRASSNTNPATGSQTRMAFMAYINNPTTPTEVEFQYVRSVSSKTASQQCDQVFVYKLTSASGGTWTVTTRDMTSKVVAGTNMTSSYSNGTLTLNATDTTYSDFVGATSGAAGTAGLVPAPASGETSKYLKSDGTWDTITVPTVNDATLTIQKNGTSVGTFTANASSNVTADIEVPVITMTSTDPGEGGALAANNFIAVYNAS